MSAGCCAREIGTIPGSSSGCVGARGAADLRRPGWSRDDAADTAGPAAWRRLLGHHRQSGSRSHPCLGTRRWPRWSVSWPTPTTAAWEASGWRPKLPKTSFAAGSPQVARPPGLLGRGCGVTAFKGPASARRRPRRCGATAHLDGHGRPAGARTSEQAGRSWQPSNLATSRRSPRLTRTLKEEYTLSSS